METSHPIGYLSVIIKKYGGFVKPVIIIGRSELLIVIREQDVQNVQISKELFPNIKES